MKKRTISLECISKPVRSRRINIENNRPPRESFMWTVNELNRAMDIYRDNFPKPDFVSKIAHKLERSELAVAMKLSEIGVVSLEELETYRHRHDSQG